jgi:hypothetical protein
MEDAAVSVVLSGSAPVAQLDRASDFESAGRPFESGRVRHILKHLEHSEIRLNFSSIRFRKIHRKSVPFLTSQIIPLPQILATNTYGNMGNSSIACVSIYTIRMPMRCSMKHSPWSMGNRDRA